MKSRSEALESIAGKTFDLCVIGGGATGAGCALDSQLRGFPLRDRRTDSEQRQRDDRDAAAALAIPAPLRDRHSLMSGGSSPSAVARSIWCSCS